TLVEENPRLRQKSRTFRNHQNPQFLLFFVLSFPSSSFYLYPLFSAITGAAMAAYAASNAAVTVSSSSGTKGCGDPSRQRQHYRGD
uniref:Uncharacterized protein n=1 Tax=Oryza brachyantha TaxID=4533 RepID=J3L155_ORYBR